MISFIYLILVVVVLMRAFFIAFTPLVFLAVQAAEPEAKTLQPHPRGYVGYRVEKPIQLDGKLDDAAWQAAPWSDDFVDIEGDKKPKPRHRTRMKMLWDDKGLYIGAELEEPHIWATLTEHDAVIFQDNDFEVFLDPDGDNHLYAELELNAKNTTWDLLLPKPYKDAGRAINGWEIIGLKSAVHINGTMNNPKDTDTSWSVELFWPWDGLKELTGAAIPPKVGDQWRINFSRVEWDTEIVDGKYVKVKGKPEYNWVWSPQGVINMHRPERWGYLQFSSAKPGTAKFTPDDSAAVRDLLHEAYYAQKTFHEKNKRFAKDAEELKLKSDVKFEMTRNGFEAFLNTKAKRWAITNDARVFSEEMK